MVPSKCRATTAPTNRTPPPAARNRRHRSTSSHSGTGSNASSNPPTARNADRRTISAAVGAHVCSRRSRCRADTGCPRPTSPISPFGVDPPPAHCTSDSSPG
ncbi:hypothetical protein [Actinosynnema pretiosum]|uniref:hypothetical protein n=1 Tax=Actinosynnema pretiosum TaxID=42197 RepID=UPI0020A36AB0|nr:hypothetical protein [Actinosynnema pretiosum]